MKGYFLTNKLATKNNPPINGFALEQRQLNIFCRIFGPTTYSKYIEEEIPTALD